MAQRFRSSRRFSAAGCLLWAVISLAASASADGAAAVAPGPRPSIDTLTVFAAASLRESFTDIAAAFEREQPGVHVALSFAGSQELRVQLEQGAPADVFASADQRQMDAVRGEGLAGPPQLFARNEPVLIAPPGNPAGVRTLRDLAATKHLVLGTPEVPIGAYTERILDAAGREFGADFAPAVRHNVASRELDVRQVLAKVVLGEADAGIVYRSDAQAAADKVLVIAIPTRFNQLAEYPIATVASSKHPRLARLFVEAVLAPAGQASLARRGFVPAAR